MQRFSLFSYYLADQLVLVEKAVVTQMAQGYPKRGHHSPENIIALNKEVSLSVSLSPGPLFFTFVTSSPIVFLT